MWNYNKKRGGRKFNKVIDFLGIINNVPLPHESRAMVQPQSIKYVYILFGSKEIIHNYRRNTTTPLIEDPFEYMVKRYELYDNTIEVIREALLYSSYTEITEEEYNQYHKYLCGAIDLIFTDRLLHKSKQT